MAKDLDDLTRTRSAYGEDYSKIGTQVGIGLTASDMILGALIGGAVCLTVVAGASLFARDGTIGVLPILAGMLASCLVVWFWASETLARRSAEQGALHREAAEEREAETQRQIAEMKAREID